MKRATCLWVAVLGACVATTPPPPPPPSPSPSPTVAERSTGSPPAAGPAARDEPIACGGDEIVVIADCFIEGEVAVDAHGNCQVTLTNCELRGTRVAVDAHGNAQVVITGGSVSGAKAIDAHGNAQVVLEGTAITGVIDQHGAAQVVTR